MAAQSQWQQVTAILTEGAYRRWLGIYLVRTHSMSVELLLPFRDEFGDGLGQIQRGVVAALADAAADLALRLHRDAAPARALRLDYIGAARAGNELHAHAQLVGDQVHIEIRTNDERALVARATVTAAATPADPIGARYPHQPLYPV